MESYLILFLNGHLGFVHANTASSQKSIVLSIGKVSKCLGLLLLLSIVAGELGLFCCGFRLCRVDWRKRCSRCWLRGGAMGENPRTGCLGGGGT